jgi:hypothetical protein
MITILNNQLIKQIVLDGNQDIFENSIILGEWIAQIELFIA